MGQVGLGGWGWGWLHGCVQVQPAQGITNNNLIAAADISPLSLSLSLSLSLFSSDREFQCRPGSHEE